MQFGSCYPMYCGIYSKRPDNVDIKYLDKVIMGEKLIAYNGNFNIKKTKYRYKITNEGNFDVHILILAVLGDCNEIG